MLTEKKVLALDRAEAFQELERQEIIPLMISEGNDSSHPHPKNAKVFALIAGIVSSAFILPVFFFHIQKKPLVKKIPDNNEKTGNVILGSSDVAGKNTVATDNSNRKEDIHGKTCDIQLQKLNKKRNNADIGNPEPGKEKAGHFPGGFKAPSDQLLAMLLSAPEGHDMPPLPLPQGKGMDKMFLQSLTNQIVIYPDDPPSAARLKKRVAEEKESLAKRFEEGESVAEIIREYQSAVRDISAIRADLIMRIRNIQEKEGTAAADKMREEVNKALEREGIPPIPRGRRAGHGNSNVRGNL